MAISGVTFERGKWKALKGVPKPLRKAIGKRLLTKPLDNAPRNPQPAARFIAQQEATPYHAAWQALLDWLASSPTDVARLEEMGGLERAKALAALLPALAAARGVGDAVKALRLPQRNMLIDPVPPAMPSTVVAFHPAFPHGRQYAATASLADRVTLHQQVEAADADLTAQLEHAKAAQAIVLKADPASGYGITALAAVVVASKADGWDNRNDKVERALAAFDSFLRSHYGQAFDYRDVKREHARAWRVYLHSDVDKKGELRTWIYQRDMLSGARTAFAAAEDMDKRPEDSNPFAKMTPVGDKPEDTPTALKIFTQAQLAALRKAAAATKWGGKHHTAALWGFDLCAYTMARPIEITMLTKSDVKREGGHVVLHIRSVDDDGDKVQGKRVKGGGSVRVVPLHPDIAESFYAYAHASTTDLIFESLPIDKTKKARKFNVVPFGNLRKAAGDIPDRLTFYNLRHTGISLLAKHHDIPERMQDYLSAHTQGKGRSVKVKAYLSHDVADLAEAMGRIQPYGMPLADLPRGQTAAIAN